uniref:DOMON domain-containing protein n=1 Tax=Hemiselmis andersenii TaxID=464988 RepID=A0A6U2I3U9_HEMAN|mmetsp:Transcript_507/g.1199  ORF Transcript_507/g.1199 Transcript_507/m.1199 type:complete len:402 (-) Transcript_507:703-1908(-)
MVSKATTTLVLAVLLVSAVHAQPGQGGPGGQSDQGRRPPKNQDGQDVQRTPPPISENRQPQSGGGRGPPSVDRSGDKVQKMFLLQSNGFNVEVNAASSTPFFRFWSDTNNMQMVKLDRMFQTSSADDITSSAPLSPVRLAGAYTWEFSDATSTVDADTNTTDVQFVVTGTPRNTDNSADKPTPGLAFTCHLLSNNNGTEMKFDVALSDWQSGWWADGAQALVIGYKVSQVDSSKRDIKNLTMSDVRIQKKANRPNRPDKAGGGTKLLEKVAMDFGNGNGFEIVSSATDTTGGTITVQMTAINTPNGGTYVLNMYNRFGGTGFTHDPSLYTAGTSGTVDPNSAETSTFDQAPPVSIGEDTGNAPNLQVTPPPGGSGGSAGSTVRAQWAYVTALLAALFALAF